MIKKLALAFVSCGVLFFIADVLTVLAKYYVTLSYLPNPFFSAGMIYQWYLLKKLNL